MASPEKQFKRAVTAYQDGKFVSARKLISKLEREVGSHPQILHLKAFIEVELGSPKQAIEALCNAAKHFPNDGNIFNALGVSYKNAEQFSDADAAHRRAIEINPDDAAYYRNYGNLLSMLGNIADAVSKYQKALELSPDSSDIALVLATDLNRVGQKNAAVFTLETQMARDPGNIELPLNLASLEHQSSNLPSARKWYKSALEMDSSNADAAGGLMSIGVLEGDVEAALSTFEAWQKENDQHHHLSGAYIHALNYRPSTTPDDIRQAAESAKTKLRLSGQPPSLKQIDRPLKIGIISRRFGGHPVNYFSSPLLAAIPSDQIQFELFASNVPESPASQSIKSLANQWHDITQKKTEERATFIRNRNLDVVISPSGHEEAELLDLFRVRLAPFQIAAFAIFGTTGVKQMDGLLSDKFQTPIGTDDDYTEDLIRMPNGYICFQPYDFLPALETRKLGSQPVFGSFNNIAKICDHTLALWSSVMQAVPNSSLLIKTVALGDQQTREKFEQRAIQAGISSERLMLEGPSSHLDLLKSYLRVDVALDPLAYSGGLTTLEALWMGAPVVTLPGETFARRHSLSHLSVAGLTHWVADSTEEYISIAGQLAEQATMRDDFRKWVREQIASSPTSDEERYASDFLRSIRAFMN